MDGRRERGIEIAKQYRIRQTPRGWIVPSQSGAGKYAVAFPAKSTGFRKTLADLGIRQSIKRVKSCYDNAVAESFFASLEKDLLRRRSFTTRQDARTAVFDYIETFYNTIRLHSTLGYLSPIEYENIKLQERRAAA